MIPLDRIKRQPRRKMLFFAFCGAVFLFVSKGLAALKNWFCLTFKTDRSNKRFHRRDELRPPALSTSTIGSRQSPFTPLIHPHRHATPVQIRLQLHNRDFIEVKQRCGQHRIRFPLRERIIKMRLCPRAAGCDHRDADPLRYRARQRQVIACFWPSQSMLVKRISPAPRRSASTAHATASIPVGILPPLR